MGTLEAVGAADIRSRNSALVLQLIWRERVISRAEIARRLDLSRSTVSAIVDALLPTGLVREVGTGSSSGGRKPILLQFEDRAFYIVGVDMGATHVGVAVTDLRGVAVAWESRFHDVREDPKGALELIDTLTTTALAAAATDFSRVVGIGVAVPSPVDLARPGRMSPVAMPSWKGYDLVEVLKKHGRPIFVDNDANLGALAEQWWGAGRDGRDLAFIKIATGIGSGHIVAGRIYRGSSGTAGEIGHLAIDTSGPACSCGLRGCLVSYVGSHAISRRCAALLPEYPGSVLATGPIFNERVRDAANAGDALALRLIEEVGRHLAVAVASLLNLLNPATVVLGGGLTCVGEALLRPVRETVQLRSHWTTVEQTTIVTSSLGEPVIAIGAATLVLSQALENQSLFPVQQQPSPALAG